jgi:hypothetical protein
MQGKDAAIATIQKLLDFSVVVGDAESQALVGDMRRHSQAGIFHGLSLLP